MCLFILGLTIRRIITEVKIEACRMLLPKDAEAATLLLMGLMRPERREIGGSSVCFVERAFF